MRTRAYEGPVIREALKGHLHRGPCRHQLHQHSHMHAGSFGHVFDLARPPATKCATVTVVNSFLSSKLDRAIPCEESSIARCVSLAMSTARTHIMVGYMPFYELLLNRQGIGRLMVCMAVMLALP